MAKDKVAIITGGNFPNRFDKGRWIEEGTGLGVHIY